MFKLSDYDDPLIRNCSDEFIRRCTFSPKAKRSVQKPLKPSTEYSDISEVLIIEPTEIQDFKQLGTRNLRYLLTMLLQLLGSSNENRASVIIKFQTRKFAGNTHKKEDSFFTLQDLTYSEFQEKCLSLLEDIQRYKNEATAILKNLKE